MDILFFFMKAAVLEAVNQLVVKEVPNPEPSGNLALIRVNSCGICLTDYKAFAGERTNVTFPTVCGHEFSGIIESIGDGVRFFKPGEDVICAPIANCGICSECRRGFTQYCKQGAVIGGDGMKTVIDGAFAEYTLVPENALYKKPANITFDAAALTEPLAGCYKGLIEYSQLKITEDLVIIGAGSMGLLAAMIAQRAGANTIILVDVSNWRLDFSKNCGATHQINSAKVDAKEAIYEIIPDGPDLVFEAAGPLPAAQLAFDLCRRGTRINEFGVTTEGTIDISPANIHWMETRVDASFSVYPRAMQQSIKLQEKGFVDAGKIITHHLSLDDIEQGMTLMTQEERVKVIIHP
ncbi:MAG TPA: alcohol dehydrogenase catalytic domain-containing protein [Candidatus Lokiarchaeia archaeon]|nr:alcohol dehydrogenase catalytic domain-containing protein [Candidatus Lokiarchaeia archaeon]